MVDLAVFPLFVDLKDRLCVVVGGGKVASRKIAVLLEFGAKIRVVSPELTDQLVVLGQEGNLEITGREYSEEDMKDAFLVIAATSDRALNERIYRTAVEKGIFVNVADSPEECTFVFPSVVKREDLVIGISTSGSFPVLSKRIREKIEKDIPESYGDLLTIVKNYRRRAIEEIKDADRRRKATNRLLEQLAFYETKTCPVDFKLECENIFKEFKDEEKDQSRKP